MIAFLDLTSLGLFPLLASKSTAEPVHLEGKVSWSPLRCGDCENETQALNVDVFIKEAELLGSRDVRHG